MKPESKRVPKTHIYSHGINSTNSKLEKTASCFDFSKLLEALNVAQEEVTIGAVVNISINASSSSDAINNAANQERTTSSTYDLSKLSEALHVIQEEKQKQLLHVIQEEKQKQLLHVIQKEKQKQLLLVRQKEKLLLHAYLMRMIRCKAYTQVLLTCPYSKSQIKPGTLNPQMKKERCLRILYILRKRGKNPQLTKKCFKLLNSNVPF